MIDGRLVQAGHGTGRSSHPGRNRAKDYTLQQDQGTRSLFTYCPGAGAEAEARRRQRDRFLGKAIHIALGIRTRLNRRLLR
jgi:hypothetical protein